MTRSGNDAIVEVTRHPTRLLHLVNRGNPRHDMCATIPDGRTGACWQDISVSYPLPERYSMNVCDRTRTIGNRTDRNSDELAVMFRSTYPAQLVQNCKRMFTSVPRPTSISSLARMEAYGALPRKHCVASRHYRFTIPCAAANWRKRRRSWNKTPGMNPTIAVRCGRAGRTTNSSPGATRSTPA